MSKVFIGRKEEISRLQAAMQSDESRFVAIFGRRRVGKTFLIRHVLGEYFTFQMTAIANATTTQQLVNFHAALQRQQIEKTALAIPKNWFAAFQQLIDFLENSTTKRKVVFLDELPWFDTKKSDFIQSLEHFWNSWASAREDVLLVTCGSSASWMINELIKNKGGLHNRVTDRIRLEPFTLAEAEAYLHTKNPAFDRYMITQFYMVFGGIPFYLKQVLGHESAVQNIERLCFAKDGVLREEFTFLLQALFAKADRHISILKALSDKNIGLSRNEIVETTKMSNSGRLTLLLKELEESGFVQKYVPFGNKKRDALYRLSDFYTAFYFKFIQNATVLDENNWQNALGTGKYNAWSGYAFEQVCLSHIRPIKKALGITGIVSQSSSWKSKTSEQGAQIDLVIDRKDHVINLFELKFSENSFTISKAYASNLGQKIQTFKDETHTRKAVFLNFISPFGLSQNAYASALVQQSFDLEVLFAS